MGGMSHGVAPREELRSGESGPRAGAGYISRAQARAPHSCANGSSLLNMQSYVVCLLVLVACAAAAPQREGAAFSKEAIKQAQNTFLIPKDAEIQKVQEGIELAAYESIPGNQRINLFEILGDQVPSEVINNLQGQIDQVGRN